MASQTALRPYRFTPGSHVHDWYVHADQNPGTISVEIDRLRSEYRASRSATERGSLARLGEAYQQLHLKHFGARH